MSDQIISVKPGVEIQLTYPDNLSSAVVSALVPSIVRTAAEVITKSGANIVSVAVQTYEETYAKIVFYQEHGRVLREEVIPIVAKAKAFQDGRNMLNKIGLDDDILSEAQDELNKRRQKRR